MSILLGIWIAGLLILTRRLGEKLGKGREKVRQLEQLSNALDQMDVKRLEEKSLEYRQGWLEAIEYIGKGNDSRW